MDDDREDPREVGYPPLVLPIDHDTHLCPEKWGVWNVTFDGWAMPGLDSWHVTREAAKRECDAWSKANGCTYEPREKGV